MEELRKKHGLRMDSVGQVYRNLWSDGFDLEEQLGFLIVPTLCHGLPLGRPAT